MYYAVARGNLDMLQKVLEYISINVSLILETAIEFRRYHIVEYMAQTYPKEVLDQYIIVFAVLAMNNKVDIIRRIIKFIPMNKNIYRELINGTIFASEMDTLDFILEISPECESQTLTSIFQTCLTSYNSPLSYGCLFDQEGQYIFIRVVAEASRGGSFFFTSNNEIFTIGYINTFKECI